MPGRRQHARHSRSPLRPRCRHLRRSPLARCRAHRLVHRAEEGLVAIEPDDGLHPRESPLLSHTVRSNRARTIASRAAVTRTVTTSATRCSIKCARWPTCAHHAAAVTRLAAGVAILVPPGGPSAVTEVAARAVSEWRNETTQKDGSDPVRSMQTQYATDGATGCAARTDYGFCLTTPSFNPSMPKMLFIVCTVPSLRPCSIS